MAKDPLTGEAVEVLWVKGSGGDIGTDHAGRLRDALPGEAGGAEAALSRRRPRGRDGGLLPHCTFNLNPRAASIDTPLHAFVPKKHVDHMHPDAVIAIAAAENSEALTREIYGDEIGWLPWKRPGFELGLWLEKFAREHPKAVGVVLESHGLFTWDDDADGVLRTTLRIINRAIEWFEGERPASRRSAGRCARRCPRMSAGASPPR